MNKSSSKPSASRKSAAAKTSPKPSTPATAGVFIKLPPHVAALLERITAKKGRPDSQAFTAFCVEAILNAIAHRQRGTRPDYTARELAILVYQFREHLSDAVAVEDESARKLACGRLLMAEDFLRRTGYQLDRETTALERFVEHMEARKF